MGATSTAVVFSAERLRRWLPLALLGLAGVLLGAAWTWRQKTLALEQVMAHARSERDASIAVPQARSTPTERAPPANGVMADFMRRQAGQTRLQIVSLRFVDSPADGPGDRPVRDQLGGVTDRMPTSFTSGTRTRPEVAAEVQGRYGDVKRWLMAVDDRFPGLTVIRVDARLAPTSTTAPSDVAASMITAQLRWRWLPEAALERPATASSGKQP